MTPRVGVVCLPGLELRARRRRGARRARRLGRDRLARRRPSLDGVDAVVIPGGFAHGDYLRPGAIARFSPVMAAVERLRRRGRSRARDLQRLPGAHRGGLAARRARSATTGCGSSARPSSARSSSTSSVLTSGVPTGRDAPAADQPLRGQLHLRRRDARRARARTARSCCATATTRTAPRHAIAGVANPAGNVVGLMPHPERASDPLLGSARTASCFSGRSSTRHVPARAVRAGARRRRASRPRPPRSGARRAPQHLGRDARLAPGGVVDALAGAVLRRPRRRSASSSDEMSSAPSPPSRRALDGLALLDEVEPLQGIGVAQACLDIVELLAQRLGARAATAARAAALERLEIAAHGEALCRARRQAPPCAPTSSRIVFSVVVMTPLWPRPAANVQCHIDQIPVRQHRVWRAQ